MHPSAASLCTVAGGGYNPNAGVNPLQESILRIMSGPEGKTEHGIDVNNVSSRLLLSCPALFNTWQLNLAGCNVPI